MALGRKHATRKVFAARMPSRRPIPSGRCGMLHHGNSRLFCPRGLRKTSGGRGHPGVVKRAGKETHDPLQTPYQQEKIQTDEKAATHEGLRRTDIVVLPPPAVA